MRTILLPGLAIAALAAPAAAQRSSARPDSTARAGVSRDSAARTLRGVLVREAVARRAGYAPSRTTTATKTDTPLRDVPQAVTVVTRALIADQGMQGMADVVRYVPGVTMGQGEGHRDAPTIRGNASTADFFVDGVRDDAQYLRDLYNVERVEALKGANAMIFGRGGGGGVLNRVTREAGWAPTRTLSIAGGSFDHRRGTLDLGGALGGPAAGRLNAMYERSGAFRDATTLRRFGVNPTATLALSPRTTARLGYELFDDRRTVDRGIPSFQGRPSAADITTFFGNPDVNVATARVHQGTAAVEHATASGLTVRNRTRVADYDKFYRNTFPGAVNAAGTQVTLSAYDHAVRRRNVFNQTDLTWGAATGAVRHTLLAGAEVGRQATEQYRNTGYFGTATSLSVPLGAPTTGAPVAFRQSATDADNGATVRVAALYAQDQAAITPWLDAVAGVRVDRFDIRFRDHRTGAALRRDDALLSPRVGLVAKPTGALSLYGAWSVSHLPSSGDQFTALTVTTQALRPERFANRELGAKWDALPGLAVTGAVYRLTRTNTTAPDPADPSRVVQTGAQRTTGGEVGVTGSVGEAWQIAGGWATQRATVIRTTAAAKAGASVPLVPHRTLSLWNRWQATRRVGLGLGVVHQADMWAAIDNTVTLPAFTRADGALYVALARRLRAQLNVENLLDARYYGTSHGNNNIMPGAPRTVRLTLATGL